jgi:uncharacterized membrane protein HdeD (DUF308 family)
MAVCWRETALHPQVYLSEAKMKILEKTFSSENFEVNWLRIFIQGILLMLIGFNMALASIFHVNAVVLNAKEFSWLPLSGLIVLFLGLQECTEALFSKISREFHQNLQVGILDTVTGALIILSISGLPERLSLMLASFLIVRGSVRIVLNFTLKLPQPLLTLLFGVISIVFGICLLFEWPTTEAWFTSLALNTEIAFRGWAMMMFALWVKRRIHQQSR